MHIPTFHKLKVKKTKHLPHCVTYNSLSFTTKTAIMCKKKINKANRNAPLSIKTALCNTFVAWCYPRVCYGVSHSPIQKHSHTKVVTCYQEQPWFRNSLSLRTPHQKLRLSAILAKRIIIFFNMGLDTKSMMIDNLTTRRDTTAINLSRANQ